MRRLSQLFSLINAESAQDNDEDENDVFEDIVDEDDLEDYISQFKENVAEKTVYVEEIDVTENKKTEDSLDDEDDEDFDFDDYDYDDEDDDDDD